MEKQKTLNLLNEPGNSKFVTRKLNIVSDLSGASYGVGNKTIYITEFLKSNLCDYNVTYILVRDAITSIGHEATKVVLKN